MSDLVGSAVLEVTANISQFDAKLSEAQSRATAAVSGINAKLSKIQGMDVVINKVGTLNLQSEINQIEIYKAQLAGLRGELASVAAASAASGSGMMTSGILPSGRIAGYDSAMTSQKEYLAMMSEMNAQIKVLEDRLIATEELYNTRLNAAFKEREAMAAEHIAKTRRMALLEAEAMRMSAENRAAVLAHERRVDEDTYTGSGITKRTGIWTDADTLNELKKQRNVETLAKQTPYVGTTAHTTRSAMAEYEAYIKEENALFDKHIGDVSAAGLKEAAAWEKTTGVIRTIQKQQEIDLEAHNARLKAAMAGGYNPAMLYSTHTTGKAATPGVEQMSGELALARAAANRKSIGAFAMTGTSTERSTIDMTSKSLETMRKRGLEPLQHQLDSAGTKINKLAEGSLYADGAVSSLHRSFGRLGRTLFAFVGVTAFVEMAMGLYQAASAGIEFNKTIESVRIGMAALLEAEGQFTRNGKPLDATESLNASLRMTDDIIKKLQYDNLQTVATFEQLTKAYQSALAPGLAAGFNVEQIRQYTLGMVQAASAMQLPLDMLAEELRSMLRGTITPRNTIIATNLGITNADIRKYQGDAQGLFDFVMGRLEKFKAYGPLLQNSFGGLYSNLTDMFKLVAGQAGVPFFEYLKQTMKDLTGWLVIVNDKTGSITLNPSAVESMSNFYEMAKLTLDVFGTLAITIAAVFSSMGGVIKKLKELMKPVLDDMEKMGQRSKYIADAMSKYYMDKAKIPTPSLGMGEGEFYEPTLGAKEKATSANEYKGNMTELQALIEMRAKLQKDINDLAARASEGETPWSAHEKQLMAETQGKLWDVDKAINAVSNSMMTATEAAHASANANNANANSLSNIEYGAHKASISLEELYKALQKAGGVNLGKMSQNLDDKIAQLDGEIAALQAGEKKGARVTAAGELAKANAKLEETRALLAEQKGVSDSIVVQAYNQARENQAKAQSVYSKTITRENLEDAQKKKIGGGAPKSFTSTFDKIAREERKFQQQSKDAWSEYWIDVFESSGMYYEAAKLKTDKWYDDEKFKLEEASQKIQDEIKVLEERIARGAASKAGNVPETQQKLSNLKAEDIGLDEAKKLLEYRRDQRKEQDEYMKLKAPEMWASENLELAKLVGTTQEQVYWENELNKAKAGLAKQDKPAWMQSLIDQRSAIENQRNLNLKGDDFGAGFKQAAFDAQQTLPQLGQLGADAFKMLTDSIDSAADALTELVTTGKMSFTDFANSIIKDMIRIMMKQLMMQTVMGTLNMLGLVSGAGSGSAGVLAGMDQSWASASLVPRSHDGTRNVGRMIPSSYFFNAPRLHNGLLSADEYPAILQKGEKVIPKNQAIGASSSVTVNITQNGGSGSMPEMQQLGDIVGKAVDAKVQENFSKQMKNGGLLDRRRAI